MNISCFSLSDISDRHFRQFPWECPFTSKMFPCHGVSLFFRRERRVIFKLNTYSSWFRLNSPLKYGAVALSTIGQTGNDLTHSRNKALTKPIRALLVHWEQIMVMSKCNFSIQSLSVVLFLWVINQKLPSLAFRISSTSHGWWWRWWWFSWRRRWRWSRRWRWWDIT